MRVTRRSESSDIRAINPSASSSRTVRVMLGGRTCSAAARSPRAIGPPNTTTESADSFGCGQPSRHVDSADATEQVDRNRVQPVGKREFIRHRK